MFNYGDEVTYLRTGQTGEVIGFMRGCGKVLVKFGNTDNEKWIPENILEKKEKEHE